MILSRYRPMLRGVFPLLLLLFVAGCGNVNDHYQQISRLLFPNRQPPNPRIVALQLRGAEALQVSFPQWDREGRMLKEGQRDGVASWLSPDGAMLMTRQGMLVATRGFGEGLMASDIRQPLAMVLGNQTGLSERFHSYLTGNDQIVTRTYRCTIENRGLREIQVGAAPVKTRLMAEDCNSLDQTFFNLYWVSLANNNIVQTRQWTGDLMGIVATRVVP